jgi:hypothetical protein
MSAEKKMKIMIFTTVAILGILAGGIAQANSLNLTGTWEGQAVCDELIDGKYTFDIFPDPLEITQDGDIVHVAAFGVLYEGTVQPLEGGPNDGEAVIHACGGTPENEVARIQHIETKPNGEGRLDAITLFESDFFFPGSRAYGTCKWTYTRVSDKDPQVSACH